MIAAVSPVAEKQTLTAAFQFKNRRDFESTWVTTDFKLRFSDCSNKRQGKMISKIALRRIREGLNSCVNFKGLKDFPRDVIDEILASPTNITLNFELIIYDAD